MYDDGVNIWDNGYPSGGNYWDDYTGEDNFHGPNQNFPGGDGIGDTRYYIPEYNNTDNYPFMEPDGWVSEGSVVPPSPGVSR